MKKEETIGSRLKKARLKLGRTFDDVYKDLKIHPNILESLEKNEIDPAIGEVYIKGFLKKYARYLGVEDDKMSSEYAARPLFEEIIKVHSPLIIKNRFKKSLLPLVATLALIFTISVISYAAFHLVSEFKKFRPAPSGAFTEAGLEAGGPALVIAKDKPLVLKVETKNKVWLRVKSDGKIIFEHTLAKGSVESWKAKDELELWVGRAEALDLTLNDKPLGSPGRGRIRSIIINHKGLKIQKK